MRIRFSTLSLCLSALPIAAVLSGCAVTETAGPITSAGAVIKGNVHGGQPPVVGAHVYLMQASTVFYNSPSVSLLNPAFTGQGDSIGGYVLTDATGSFTVTGDYTCTQNTQIYLYSLGGNPGGGPNSAAGFLAALGDCPVSGTFASTVPFVYMNEVSTVAAAYAIAGYAVDATHVGAQGTPLALTGLSNAFASAANIASISTGTARTTTPAGNGTVPQATINTIANILAACVNSTGPTSTPCTTLFTNAKSPAGSAVTPTETATAAINIAHSPGANVATLFGLINGTPAFSPTLTTAPNDFLLAVGYSGVGNSGANNGAYSIAMDGRGNSWFVNVNNNTVSKFSRNGAPLSPAAGFANTALFIPAGIAIDLNDNAWVVDSGTSNIVEISPSGTVLGTFNGGGLATPQDIAIDGQNNVWAVNFPTNSLSKFSHAGVALSPPTGYVGGNINKPTSLASDQNGNVWVTNQLPGTGSISKFNSNGVPITVTAGYTGGGLNNPQSAAFDHQNNIWIGNFGNNSLSAFSPNGTPISPSTGFTGGGLNKPYTLSIDGSGNIWVANSGGTTISEFSNAGVPLSPPTGFGLGLLSGPNGLSVDGAGNVWIANTGSTTSGTSVFQLIGAAVPVVTSTAFALQQGALGARP